ncbi:MAG: hypothetical protein AAGK23_12660, partial [Pseudomonadota bacterium]
PEGSDFRALFTYEHNETDDDCCADIPALVQTMPVLSIPLRLRAGWALSIPAMARGLLLIFSLIRG